MSAELIIDRCHLGKKILSYEQMGSAVYYEKCYKHSCYHLCKVSIDPRTMTTYNNNNLRVHSPLPYVFHAFRKIMLPPYFQIRISKTATGL
jgi:hypothetical protein